MASVSVAAASVAGVAGVEVVAGAAAELDDMYSGVCVCELFIRVAMTKKCATHRECHPRRPGMGQPQESRRGAT